MKASQCIKSDRVVIFYRGDFFYPVIFTHRCKVEDHVKLNPGTTKVEELSGQVIWPVGPMQKEPS